MGIIGVIIVAYLIWFSLMGLMGWGGLRLFNAFDEAKANREYQNSKLIKSEKGASYNRIKVRGSFIKGNTVEINSIRYKVLSNNNGIAKLMTINPVPIYTVRFGSPVYQYNSFVYYYKEREGGNPCWDIDIDKAKKEHRSALFEVRANMNFLMSQSGNDVNGITVAEFEKGWKSITEAAIVETKRTSVFLTKYKKGDFQIQGENSNQNLKIIETKNYSTGLYGGIDRRTIRMLSIEDIFEYYGKNTVTAEEVKKFVNNSGTFWLHNFCTNNPISVMCLNGNTGSVFYQKYDNRAKALAVITVDTDKLYR